MIVVLIATRNAHKVAEIRAILGERFQYLTLQDFPKAPAVIEDAPTFAGNAAKKAVELARWICSGLLSPTLSSKRGEGADAESSPGRQRVDFVLADDSGLEVDALNGAPGVHSARFAARVSGAEGNSSDKDNCAKLLRLLREVPIEKRTARFRCVVALTPVLEPVEHGASPVCYADEFELRTQIAEGACEGRIILEPKGRGGFGYDPLFVPEGYQETFAELAEEVKNRISHRARALERLTGMLP